MSVNGNKAMRYSSPDHELLVEQQRLLYKNSTGPILVSLLIAVFLCWYLQNSRETVELFSWLAACTLVAAGRLSMVLLAGRDEQAGRHGGRLDLFFLNGIWLSAIIWGAASFVLFPNASPMHQTVFSIIIIGISAGAISTLCSNWPAIAGFLTFTLLPLAAKFLMLQDRHGAILGILVVLYWLVCLAGAQKLHRNITENISLRLQSQENEKDLRIGKERYQHIFNHSPLGIVHYDSSGIILECNEIFAGVIGLPASLLTGRNLLSSLENVHIKTAVGESLRTGHGFFEGEYAAAATGRKTPVRISLKTTNSPTNTILGGIGILEDFTERTEFEQQIDHQARYDSLTGLPNRRQLLEQLDLELSRALRHGQNGALLFMDLDNFKTINDALGHQAGDAVLKQVAERLLRNLRKEDIAARMGGDEFVILLPHLDHSLERAARKSQDIAKKLTKVLTVPFAVDSQELNITSSIGISLFPERTKAAEDILKQADTAMNQAKTAGRNTVRFFLPSMQQAADKQLRLNNDLKRALENDEFSVYFQPQVKADGTIVGAEGLLRWVHPERGLIMPGEFIPAAEETGIIVDIGSWVLRKICRTIKDWENNHLLNDNQTIAVNISAREFSAPDFVEKIVRTLDETGIKPHHLDIELTEGSLISSVSDTIDKIRTLREYGIKFSVDDFGTGYSSLSYLKSLPLHTLKIDRSFVNDLRPVGNDVTLVEIIITMARNLGLEIVAEGVETAEELSYLAAKGCCVYQGYYFCKPVPTAEFRKLLAAGKVEKPNFNLS
jgi:diguanylate cyclase (GGDEF)-like protein/PAS domain S-box-containing protein